jgi:Ran GTPase-activating protein (RanGAP) involved in mRNA processing and transport
MQSQTNLHLDRVVDEKINGLEKLLQMILSCEKLNVINVSKFAQRC